MEYTQLFTKQGMHLDATPWQAYPRPSLRRDSFWNLNGTWDFAVGQNQSYSRTIRVPFPPESLLSGVNQVFPQEQKLYYRRRFPMPPAEPGNRVLLHFGAVDQIARVWLNGEELGTHVGGYQSFSFEITQFLQPENTLVVEVEDWLDTHVLPYGKQRRDRGGMWYTPVSGIWQTVWMEQVPQEYIQDLHIHTQENQVDLSFVGTLQGDVRIVTPDGTVTCRIVGGTARAEIPSPRYWSPEDPYLYRVEVTSGQDRVETYFAFRTLEVRHVAGVPRLCLNGKPYFFHGVLDQGYWSDGLFTPAAPECLEEDILSMKELGFNTLRKHIKVEPELFYYACDRLGMIVFQDMVNNGHYHYFGDTVLPTAGLKTRKDTHLHRDPETRARFREGMEQTVLALSKHPSVCYWTIFNEGWGQFDSQTQYESLKQLDTSRFVDTTSGWFRCGDSDVESIHVYFKPVKLPKSGKPIVLSEFGGYSYKPEGHVFNTEKNYGYRFFREQEDFMDALETLYREEVIPAKEKGLCGAIYTQLSDVEDETNGLYSYDRMVCKVDKERMRAIARALE